MPYDFPSGVPTGTVVTVPDGSYRVWDSQKWRAAPSANVVIPPTGFLPLAGGMLSNPGNLAIQTNKSYAGDTASLSNAALNISHTASGNITGTGEVDHNSLVVNDTLSVNPPANTIASFQAQIDGTTLSLNSLVSPPVAVPFTGSISGNLLSILSSPGPGLAPGATVQWPGGTDMVKIAAGPGLWTLYNTWGTIASQAMTGLANTFSVMGSVSGSTLTVASLYGPGAITAGMQVRWNLPTPGATTIITGPAGGPYTLVNPSGTIPLQPMLLLGPQPAQTVTWDSGDPDNPGTVTVGSYITGHPAQFNLLTNQGTVSSRPMQTVKAVQNRNVFGFSSFLNFGGGDGSRYGWRLNISQTAPMAAHGVYLPAYIVNRLRYPSGGTDLWAGAKGTGWAGNTVMSFEKPGTSAVSDPGPVNFRGGSSWEFDYQCFAGSPDDPAYPKATTATLGGIAVIRGGVSTWETPMWESDYAIAISQQGPLVRDLLNNAVRPKAAKIGLRFGSTGGLPAIDPLHGRAIAAVYGLQSWNIDGTPGIYANQAPFGVDWIMFDYTRAPYRWQGGAVLGSATPLPGALAIGGGYLSATNTTVSLDTAGSVCTNATVASGQGGANLYLGMVCIDDNTGTQVVVTGVDGAVSPRIGAATTVSLIPRTGQSHNAEIPTNPVQFRPMGNPLTFLAPGPTGPKLNLTWTAPTTLALQPSGGATTFGGPVTLPSGTTGPFLPLATGGTVAAPTVVSTTTSNAFSVRTTDGNTALSIANIAGQNRLAINTTAGGGFTIFDYAAGSAKASIGAAGGVVTMPFITGGALSNQALGAGGTLNPYVSYSGTISGVKTAGAGQLFLVQTTSDTMSTPGGIYGAYINLTSGGTGTTGNRIALRAELHAGAGITNKGLAVGNQYAASWAYCYANGNMGGTALTPGNTWGAMWGGLSSASLQSGATFWTAAIGHEVDVGVAAGASSGSVSGLLIALVDHDQAPVFNADYLLGMAAAGNRCTNWSPKGISFGTASGVWPFDPLATLIGTTATGAGVLGPRAYTAAIGIDLSAVTFSVTPLKLPLMANAANDAAAATAGVPVGGFYRNGSIVMQRAA